MALSEKLDAIQKFILDQHRVLFGESPSPMKLQKLCYYAQGYLIAERGEPLFDEDFQAWQHGPVIPALYQEYRDLGWRPILSEFEAPAIEAAVAEELKDIVAAYGRYDGAALSTMTHREAPWINARGDLPESEGSTKVISKQALTDYFVEKLRKMNSSGK